MPASEAASAAPPPPGRAARLHGRRDLSLGPQPVPVPRLGEVLVRVSAVGLCGSDRHWYLDGSIGGAALVEPLVLGHEIAGVIAAGPEAGTRVVVEPALACQTCPTCLGGRPELCPTAGFAGHAGTDGGLQTLMAWPRRLLRVLPGSIRDDDAALLETLGVALHAVHLSEAAPGSRVAVIGCGPIGLLVIRALVAFGVTDIVADDPLPYRLAAGVRSGARPLDDETPAGAETDVAIECAGEDAAVDHALRLTRPGGRVVLVGIPGDDRTTFTASVARRKGLVLVLCRRMRPVDLERAIDLVAGGTVQVEDVISHRFPLDDVAAAFRVLVDQTGLKVVVHP